MLYIVSVTSKKHRNYRVGTLIDLPTEPKEFHKLMQTHFVQRHGWRQYSITRPKYHGEKGGYRLVCVFRITPEGVVILKIDPSSPTFPDYPSRHMWWEKEPRIPRGIVIPRKPAVTDMAVKRALQSAGMAAQPLKKIRTRRHGEMGRMVQVLVLGANRRRVPA
jgi:hypothetical protein